MNRKIKSLIVLTIAMCLAVVVIHCSLSVDVLGMEQPATEPVDAMTSAIEPNAGPAHSHEYKKSLTGPTCVTDGYTDYLCECGDTYRGDMVDARGHKYAKKIVTATCTTVGYTENTCVVCGDSYKSDYTESTDHKYTSKIVAPTCAKKGYTVHTCACGKAYRSDVTDETNHNYQVNIIESTCKERGLETRVCADCNHTEVKFRDLIGHDCDKVVTQPTCDQPGYTTLTCRVCGEVMIINRTVPKGHVFFAWRTTVNPTCTTAGDATRKCHCGKTETKTLDPMGHDVVTHSAKAATCNGAGWDEYETCARCDYSTYAEIPAVGHASKAVVVAPTCTENGYTVITCDSCGYSYKDDTTAALGHEYEASLSAPSCTEDSICFVYCNRCDYSYTEVTPAPGHKYATTTVEATTGWGGYDYHECTLCGYSYKDNETEQVEPDGWPKGYRDDTCTIVIYKEQHYGNWCYIAHLQFSDYSRFGSICAKDSLGSAETTSSAAKRVGAIFAVNGPYMDATYSVVRSGKVFNDVAIISDLGIYNAATGKFANAGDLGLTDMMASDAVEAGLVSDTFKFFNSTLVKDGANVANPNNTDKAQRTFIATNGNAGDLYIVVAEGRSADGVSPGMTKYECAKLILDLGCTYGVMLDGGGSSTMYFNGSVLNSAKNGQRAVVDFLVFK